MRNRIIRWVFCMVAVCCVFLPAAAWAENPEKVVDKARLFSEEEASHLQEFCEDAIQATGMDVVIVTTDDTEGKTAQEYADDYFDYNGYGKGSDASGILFLIDMDNREIYLSTCGIAIRYFTDSRIDWMLDDLFLFVSEGDYSGAGRVFTDQVQDYVARGIPEDQYNYDTETGETDYYRSESFWQQLGKKALVAIPVTIVLMAIAGLYAKNANGKKMAVQENTYLTNNSFRMTEQRDIFLRESVQRRKVQSNSGGGGSSGGRSSTHSSSSGRSHGGGGRRF